MSVVSDIAQIVNNTNMSVNERLIELTACKNIVDEGIAHLNSLEDSNHENLFLKNFKSYKPYNSNSQSSSSSSSSLSSSNSSSNNIDLITPKLNYKVKKKTKFSYEQEKKEKVARKRCDEEKESEKKKNSFVTKKKILTDDKIFESSLLPFEICKKVFNERIDELNSRLNTLLKSSSNLEKSVISCIELTIMQIHHVKDNLSELKIKEENVFFFMSYIIAASRVFIAWELIEKNQISKFNERDLINHASDMIALVLKLCSKINEIELKITDKSDENVEKLINSFFLNVSKDKRLLLKMSIDTVKKFLQIVKIFNFDDCVGINGLTNYDGDSIYLYTKRSDDRTEATFHHELYHALLRYYSKQSKREIGLKEILEFFSPVEHNLKNVNGVSMEGGRYYEYCSKGKYDSQYLPFSLDVLEKDFF